MLNKSFASKKLIYPALFAFIGLMGCNPEEDMSPTTEMSAESALMAQGNNPNNVRMLSDKYVGSPGTELEFAL